MEKSIKEDMNKKLFDLTPVVSNYSNGGSEYCKAVFWELIVTGRINEFDVLMRSDSRVNQDVEEMISEEGIQVVYYNSRSELQEIINKYALFYSALPYDYCDISLNRSVRFVYTIHGLRDIEMLCDSLYLDYERNSIKAIIKYLVYVIYPSALLQRAQKRLDGLINVTDNRRIIVVSQHTKHSLLVHSKNLDEAEISVCYSPRKRNINEITRGSKRLVEQEYILMISGNRWIKNDLRAAIAIDELITEGLLEEKVIITGVINKKTYLKKLKNKDRFELIDYVKESQLENLYEHAKLFVFPSLNEGFGYPPVEAMKYGTVCACAADSSIPEVCGDAVFYFNPYDVNEIKCRVLQSLNGDERKTKKEKIKDRIDYISKRQQIDLARLIDELCRK